MYSKSSESSSLTFTFIDICMSVGPSIEYRKPPSADTLQE